MRLAAKLFSKPIDDHAIDIDQNQLHVVACQFAGAQLTDGSGCSGYDRSALGVGTPIMLRILHASER